MIKLSQDYFDRLDSTIKREFPTAYELFFTEERVKQFRHMYNSILLEREKIEKLLQNYSLSTEERDTLLELQDRLKSEIEQLVFLFISPLYPLEDGDSINDELIRAVLGLSNSEFTQLSRELKKKLMHPKMKRVAKNLLL